MRNRLKHKHSRIHTQPTPIHTCAHKRTRPTSIDFSPICVNSFKLLFSPIQTNTLDLRCATQTSFDIRRCTYANGAVFLFSYKESVAIQQVEVIDLVFFSSSSSLLLPTLFLFASLAYNESATVTFAFTRTLGIQYALKHYRIVFRSQKDVMPSAVCFSLGQHARWTPIPVRIQRINIISKANGRLVCVSRSSLCATLVFISINSSRCV